MSLTIYKESSKNIPTVNNNSDMLVLDKAGSGCEIDVTRHLKTNAGRVLISFPGSGTQSVTIKINAGIRVIKRNLEQADEVIYSFKNPHTIEYAVEVTAPTTWDSGTVFGKIPIHSMTMTHTSNISSTHGVDLIFIPFPFS